MLRLLNNHVISQLLSELEYCMNAIFLPTFGIDNEENETFVVTKRTKLQICRLSFFLIGQVSPLYCVQIR